MMPLYSDISKERLDSTHQDLQTIFHYVIQIVDNSIVYGLRTAEEQFALYRIGRRDVGNNQLLITDEKKVVTYKDGYVNKSKHQSGMAIDVVPYPGGWKAPQKRFFELAGVIKATAYLLKKHGDISHDIDWGYDLWDWDLCHYELKQTI